MADRMIAADAFSAAETASEKPCALLWDESFLWGIMARRALLEAGLSFDLVRAEQVRRGDLTRYRLLFVPGGWASSKRAALGDTGCSEIRRFVEAGGNYLGICGGAGLATRDEIALLPVVRKPSARRVTSFSGGIRVSPVEDPIWRGVEKPVFSAWWPSQLTVDGPGVRVLAAYEEAQSDAVSADISVKDGERRGWPVLEEAYGILLDPARLRGEPAVLEGRCGHGKVVLSMLHFDTPGDRNGMVVLKNLWRLLAIDSPPPPAVGSLSPPGGPRTHISPEILRILAEIRACVEGLIAAGEESMLWRWRNPFLLRWRRGVRGLEYSTLSVMVREIQDLLACDPRDPGAGGLFSGALDKNRLRGDLLEIRRLLVPFVDRAKRLIGLEWACLQSRQLSPLHCDDREIQSLRRELFGSAMSHGGAFKRLIDAVDLFWFRLVRNADG